MGQFISKEEKPVATHTVNCMDIPYLPDEILLKIMEYLSNKDVLKNLAQVSRKFHGLSRDPHLIKKIEFKSIEFTYRWMFLSWNWSDERKEKYFNDFLQVLSNVQKLKVLSLQLDEQSMGTNFPFLGNHQCLEEFCIQIRNVESADFPDYLINGVFKVLDQCPKLKVLKIEIYWSWPMTVSQNFNNYFFQPRIAEIFILPFKFKLRGLQEFHVNFKDCLYDIKNCCCNTIFSKIYSRDELLKSV